MISEQIYYYNPKQYRENKIRIVSESSHSDSAPIYMSKYMKGNTMCMREARFNLGLVQCPLMVILYNLTVWVDHPVNVAIPRNEIRGTSVERNRK